MLKQFLIFILIMVIAGLPFSILCMKIIEYKEYLETMKRFLDRGHDIKLTPLGKILIKFVK